MSASGDLYAKILARFQADTGAGGFFASSAPSSQDTAFLRGGVYRQDDPDDQSNNYNRIEVQIMEQDHPYFGSGADGLKMLVNFRVITDYIDKFTGTDAIVQRLLHTSVGFHRWQPAASSDWNWSPMLRRSAAGQGITTQKKERITLVPFICTARRL